MVPFLLVGRGLVFLIRTTSKPGHPSASGFLFCARGTPASRPRCALAATAVGLGNQTLVPSRSGVSMRATGPGPYAYRAGAFPHRPPHSGSSSLVISGHGAWTKEPRVSAAEATPKLVKFPESDFTGPRVRPETS
jgi:hypothetical protein